MISTTSRDRRTTSITLPKRAVPATQPRPCPIVLAIGDERFSRRLGEHLPDARVRNIQAPDETDGYGVELIVVVGTYPLSTLADVLVHPTLSRLPVVLVAPGRDIDRRGWAESHVHVVLDREDPVRSAADHIRQELRSGPGDPGHLVVRSRPAVRRGAREIPPSATGNASLTAGGAAERRHRGEQR